MWRFALLQLVSAETKSRSPHIVLFIADDLGWNDVSWNNPKMFSPFLESLARGGVILDQHYVLPMCTPTRAALLTGRYPYKLGIQGHGIRHLEPYGLPLGMTTLAEELKRRNYTTHAFGKWHLGYCNWSLTPTHRGFDTFRGYYLGSQDHFNHTVTERKNGALKEKKGMHEKEGGLQANGYDYRNGEKVDLSAKGIYSTTLITNHVLETIAQESKNNSPMFLYVAFQAVHAPLQVPSKKRTICSNHTYNKRVKICEMLGSMDHAVELIVKKLKDVQMWNNTLLVFMSDNGAQVLFGGNNSPLRGNKNTLYEGGTRVPAFVAGPAVKRRGYRSSREGHLKFILRPSKAFGSWYSESQEEFESVESVGNVSESVLYNITADPNEENDLSWTLKTETERLLSKMRSLAHLMVPSHSPDDDPRGNPTQGDHTGVFSPGWCKAPVWKQPQTATEASTCQ
ncbi:arylsulfatase B [Rhipicephalus sanguineus]|uniref:arylsulfatase B n=1 Tax=Rhipicephalus sanguineus TaxID=34632 RepID=UPI0020C37B04|nr:arylsulfatase B [Rhipicephalus sanguineus]